MATQVTAIVLIDYRLEFPPPRAQRVHPVVRPRQVRIDLGQHLLHLPGALAGRLRHQLLPRRQVQHRYCGPLRLWSHGWRRRRGSVGRYDSCGRSGTGPRAAPVALRLLAPLPLKGVLQLRRRVQRLKGLLSHVDPQMTTGQLLGRLVQEALDRHDPSRPPRGRRAGRRSAEVAGATSAPKDLAAPDATAAPRTAQSAGAVSSRDATPARRPAAASRTAEVAGATSAPKDAAGPDTAAAAGIATSAPKEGHGWQRAAAPTAPRTVRLATAGAAPPQHPVRSRAIPAAIRRQVWERDRGCCSYVDEGSGRRCGSAICWRGCGSFTRCSVRTGGSFCR